LKYQIQLQKLITLWLLEVVLVVLMGAEEVVLVDFLPVQDIQSQEEHRIQLQ